MADLEENVDECFFAENFDSKNVKPFYSPPLFEEESKIEIMREKNPGLIIENIHFPELNEILPMHCMSIMIHLWITYLLESKKYSIAKLKNLQDFLSDTIELSNIMMYKMLTRLESKKKRMSTIRVISQSMSQRNPFDEDEDLDIDGSDDGISTLFDVDEEFIYEQIKNIVGKNYFFPKIGINDFFNEINFNLVRSSSHVAKSFEFLIDRKFSLAKKKLLLLRGIFRNNDSDNSKLTDLILHVENLDCNYAEKRLLDLKSIPKSIWHLYHSMDISFLIAMLIWIEDSANKNPHEVFVMVAPLLRYLLKCLNENKPKMQYVSDFETPYVAYVENDIHLQRNRKNMKHNLETLIQIIDRSRSITECDSCRLKISAIINNQEMPHHREDQDCDITSNLKKLRQSIHNLNKHTKKKFNHGESQKATAVSPVLKQILSLIGTISNINNNNYRPREIENLSCSSSSPIPKKVTRRNFENIHESTTKIVDIKNFNVQFTQKEDLVFEISNDFIKNLTILPLNFSELFKQESYKSFFLTFQNRTEESITISIHKVFVEREGKQFYFIIDNFTKDDTDKCSAGILVISENLKNIIRYLKNSIYSDKKLQSFVEIIKFSADDMKNIKIYLKKNQVI